MTLILFLLLLSVIVILHEGGHLIAAKIFNVYCSEYSIGMGPVLWQKQGKETVYSVRALPIGGFVAMAGDTDNELETKVDDSEIPPERTLTGIAKWKKIIIMLAGIAMNFLLAWVIIALVLNAAGGYSLSPKAEIASVVAGSPAEKAGLQAGDLILEISSENGTSVKPKQFDDLTAYMMTYQGDYALTYKVQRGEQVIDLTVYPSYDNEEGRYLIGIYAPPGEVVKVNLLNCWYYSFDYCRFMISTMLMSLGQLFRGVGLNQLSGPIGIYQATGEAASMGASSYLLMVALISLNIGLINALPLPILDGGRVLLTLVEAVMGRPLSKKMENALMTASTILVLMLFVFATSQDLLRLFK